MVVFLGDLLQQLDTADFGGLPYCPSVTRL